MSVPAAKTTVFAFSFGGCGGVFRRRRKRQKSKRNGIGTPKRHTNTGKRERTKADKKKRGRTMDTSFVVSAAFCAPVVTESQNDMAVLVAIAVWTEMVACLSGLLRAAREQSALFSDAQSVSLYAAFFHTPQKKNAERNRSQRSTMVRSIITITMSSSSGIIERNSFRSSSAHFS